jgi:hypothetical protein
LLSYGSNFSDIFRRAAAYVDRILRGANPSELPVQAPTKYELVINLKTAKAFGLDVPLFLQQRADEVIGIAMLFVTQNDHRPASMAASILIVRAITMPRSRSGRLQ